MTRIIFKISRMRDGDVIDDVVLNGTNEWCSCSQPAYQKWISEFLERPPKSPHNLSFAYQYAWKNSGSISVAVP